MRKMKSLIYEIRSPNDDLVSFGILQFPDYIPEKHYERIAARIHNYLINPEHTAGVEDWNYQQLYEVIEQYVEQHSEAGFDWFVVGEGQSDWVLRI